MKPPRAGGLEWVPKDELPAAIARMSPLLADLTVWHLALGVSVEEVAPVLERSADELQTTLKTGVEWLRSINELQSFAGEGSLNHPGTPLLGHIAEEWERLNRCQRCGMALATRRPRQRQFCGEECRRDAESARPVAADQRSYPNEMLQTHHAYASAILVAMPQPGRGLRSIENSVRLHRITLSWYERAAWFGHIEAFVLLARRTENDQARKDLYVRAAQRGHLASQIVLDSVEDEMRGQLLQKLVAPLSEPRSSTPRVRAAAAEILRSVADDLPSGLALPFLEAGARYLGRPDDLKQLVYALDPPNVQPISGLPLPNTAPGHVADLLEQTHLANLAPWWRARARVDSARSALQWAETELRHPPRWRSYHRDKPDVNALKAEFSEARREQHRIAESLKSATPRGK